MAYRSASFQPAMQVEAIEINEFSASIKARPRGIIAMIMTALRIGSTTELRVNAEGARLNKESLGSAQITFIPFEHISASVFHRSRPVWSLLLGILLAASSVPLFAKSGTFDSAITVLSIAIFFVVVYFFSGNSITIGLISDAGLGETLKLKATADETTQLNEVLSRIDQMILWGKEEVRSPVGMETIATHGLDMKPSVNPDSGLK